MITPNYEYECEVVRWTDGDTCDVEIDLGFNIRLSQRVRVYGLNTHETRSGPAAERILGMADKAFAEQLLPPKSKAKMRSHKATAATEKYGRWLAEIELPGGRDFALTMIANNHGVAYFGN